MAITGARKKPSALKLVTNHRQPIPEDADFPVRDVPLDPPKKLTKPQVELWDRYINTAWWLGTHDEQKAYMWVCLQSEFNRKPAEMNSARITQLRMLGTELGFDPCARARMGTEKRGKKNQADKFFD